MYNSTIYKRYSECRDKSNDSLFGRDFPLRPKYPSVANILLIWFLIGNLYQISLNLYQSAVKEHTTFYNALDFLLLCAYIAALTLRYLLLIKFYVAVNMLSGSYVDPCSDIQYVYWLNTDRKYWLSSDPRNVSECLFAFANLMTFIRFSYILPSFRMLGAMQISMLHMLKDIAKLAVVFIIVMFAFTVGLNNLYWYYSVGNTIELNTTVPVMAQKHFGSVESLLNTAFWTLFGRGDRFIVELGNYDAATVHFGYFITGVYNIVTVTVLVNMLIAMMSRSFTRIAEDTDREWKFARSQLYMDYIGNRSSLPPPLNVLFIPKSIYENLKSSGQDKTPTDPVIEPENSSILTIHSLLQNESKDKTFQRTRPTEPLSKQISLDDPTDTDTVMSSESNPGNFKHVHLARVQSENEPLTYEQTMCRLVQRYIFDLQRQVEVIEDDKDIIKKDISSFRYDIDKQPTSSRLKNELQKDLIHIQLHVQKLKEKRKREKDEAKEKQMCFTGDKSKVSFSKNKAR
ncbi:Short transient receptor putative channel 3 [Bulinus truncatus]|nr:Short transient receptor putative channel 3 [Bulinus truncatus]